MDILKNFQNNIFYQFKDISLLEEAITHPSFSTKNNTNNYQRLEFLGDTVLGLVIAEILIKKYPQDNEGNLSKKKAYLVSGEALSKIATQINIGDIIKLSEGEKSMGGKENKRILENVCEALIGAIYLDSDLQNCQKFINHNWQEIINNIQDLPQDPVSLLQELTQAKLKKLPIYETIQTGGNSHQPLFTSTVIIDNKKHQATGSSKKEAQKNVATLAINNV